MAKFAINASGAMLLPSLVLVSESISGSVVPLAMFINGNDPPYKLYKKTEEMVKGETSQVIQIFRIFLKSSVGGGLGVLRGRTYSPGRSKMATGQDQVSHYISHKICTVCTWSSSQRIYRLIVKAR